MHNNSRKSPINGTITRINTRLRRYAADTKNKATTFCYLLSVFLDRHNVNFFIGGFCCCALNGLIALTLKETGLIPNHHFMIIGVLMLFVPEAAITNALRDLINGDTLLGEIKGNTPERCYTTFG